MTFSELLQNCSNGMPTIKSEKSINRALSNIGQVTVIKKNKDYCGCAVQFPGLNYDIWFDAIEKKDKRRHYINELSILL